MIFQKQGIRLSLIRDHQVLVMRKQLQKQEILTLFIFPSLTRSLPDLFSGNFKTVFEV